MSITASHLRLSSPLLLIVALALGQAWLSLDPPAQAQPIDLATPAPIIIIATPIVPTAPISVQDTVPVVAEPTVIAPVIIWQPAPAPEPVEAAPPAAPVSEAHEALEARTDADVSAT